MTDAEIEDLIARAQAYFESQPIARLIPPGRVAASLRAALSAPGAAEREAARFRARFDDAVVAARASPRSAADLLGREATDAVVRAIGAMEPDERLVRALFAGQAAEALIAAILYDGIVEFLKKVNALGDALPGVALAKRIGGGFLGGLAGAAFGGGVEKALEGQVKSFLQGFVKVALDRGVAFVTAPANRAMFRESRERLARMALERPARDVLGAIPEERLRAVRDDIAEAIRKGIEGLLAEGGERSAEALARRAADLLGERSAAEIADRWGLPRLDPRETAKLLAPAWRAFLESERR